MLDVSCIDAAKAGKNDTLCELAGRRNGRAARDGPEGLVVKLGSDQLVLDTNILVHWLRGKDAGTKLRTDYALGSRAPRPILPLVVKAETKSLALQFGWGADRQKALDELLRELPNAEISSERVISAYARLDQASRKLGRKIGKNDLWIAAVAAVQGAVILTTDKDIDDLHPTLVRVERIEVASLVAAGN